MSETVCVMEILVLKPLHMLVNTRVLECDATAVYLLPIDARH